MSQATKHEWQEDAACNGYDLNIFFPPIGKKTEVTAKAICATCPVQLRCLNYALKVEIDGGSESRRWGIYGGMTAGERAKLSRRTA